jgi:hypothetical protein
MACELINVLAELIPDDVYFVVGDGSYAADGATSFTVPQFAGWKVRMFRQSLLQYQGEDPGTGNTWYEYSTISGEFTVSVALAEGEEIHCQAYKPAS